MAATDASLTALRQIFLDAEAPPRARIEAAETILSYEAPADFIREAKEFLIELLEDQEMSVSLRLQASKVLRKAEAPKIQTRSVASADELAERENARQWLRMWRKAKISNAGLSPPAPGWDSDIMAADFDPIATLDALVEARRAELEEADKATK